MQPRTKEPSRMAPYIDVAADVQSEPARVAVEAGVDNLRVYYRGDTMPVPVNLTIKTSTGLKRGVHMSRLVHAANSAKSKTMEGWMKKICEEVNRSQPGTQVTASFELPHSDRFAKIVMKTTERGATHYRFTVQGMTACPCSKRMIGVGHMQRAEVTLMLKSGRVLDSRDTVRKVEECFSATSTEEMKRVDEARKILEAQANPRFAEDLVRECVKRFPNALFVRGRCYESIHAHDAVASWSAKPGWVPEL